MSKRKQPMGPELIVYKNHESGSGLTQVKVLRLYEPLTGRAWDQMKNGEPVKVMTPTGFMFELDNAKLFQDLTNRCFGVMKQDYETAFRNAI